MAFPPADQIVPAVAKPVFISAGNLLENSADKPAVLRYQGNHLPHWELMGATYAITFHLADSLPANALQELARERESLKDQETQSNIPLTGEQRNHLAYLQGQKVQAWLDAGSGACHLRHPHAAKIVQDALLHFHGERYDLLAFCVMPNHVHVVVRPYAGIGVGEMVRSWKGFTARRINQWLGRTGDFWQKDYHDRLIRDRAHLRDAVLYVAENPVKAKLENWPWMGVMAGVEEVWAGLLSDGGLGKLTASSVVVSLPQRGSETLGPGKSGEVAGESDAS